MSTIKSKPLDGQFQGVISEYGLLETKTGKVMAFIEVLFAVPGDGDHTLTWYGSLSTEKSQEYVQKTFAKLSNLATWEAIVAKAQSGEDKIGLVNAPVSVTVVNEVNPNTNETQNKIKYVNAARTKYRSVNPTKLASLQFGKHDPNFDKGGGDDDIPF